MPSNSTSCRFKLCSTASFQDSEKQFSRAHVDPIASKRPYAYEDLKAKPFVSFDFNLASISKQNCQTASYQNYTIHIKCMPLTKTRLAFIS